MTEWHRPAIRFRSEGHTGKKSIAGRLGHSDPNAPVWNAEGEEIGMAVKMLMKGAVLPGNSTVELKDFEIPTPGYGQVLVQTKATTICGSDIRCIYQKHTGKGPEGYLPGMVVGHEPCGRIVEEGGA